MPSGSSSKSFIARLAAAGAFAAVVCVGAHAHADTSVISRPGYHPRYFFEAEPHLAANFFKPGPEESDGFGPGFRGTFNLADRAFIKGINNSVGIGVGADFLFLGKHCKLGAGCNTYTEVIFPAVMQWNFWLTKSWSVFGEPGFAFRLRSHQDDKFEPFVFYAGGRYHFSDRIALTMRVGWPTFSVGASFFL
jgi:hypothetical protein